MDASMAEMVLGLLAATRLGGLYVCVCVLVRLEDPLCLPGRVDGARAGCGAAVPSVGLPDLGIPTQPSPAVPLTSTPVILGYSAPCGHNCVYQLCLSTSTVESFQLFFRLLSFLLLSLLLWPFELYGGIHQPQHCSKVQIISTLTLFAADLSKCSQRLADHLHR